MREIKFRAWDKHHKKMLYDNRYAIPFAMGGVVDWEADIDFAHQLEPMQYTGLKDKNGKEIYEGDILCLRNHKDVMDEVVWIKREARFNLEKWGNTTYLTSLFSEEFFEIIGNIYENPELVEA